MMISFSLSGLIHTLFVLNLRALALPVVDNTGNPAPLADKRAISLYAPYNSTCPNRPLVRAASGISTGESNYIKTRKSIATDALGTWLRQVHPGFSTGNLPSVGLTTSGGGLRSLLEGAGVIQAFDSRDSSVGTSGLYQGLVYQAGLSGGSWLLSSL